MDYRETLLQEFERYQKELLPAYQVTTSAAMKDAKKLGLFKKKKFGGYIADFKSHMEAGMSQIAKLDLLEIPEEDEKSREVADALKKSLRSFCLLCDFNVQFYDMTEKKQYPGSGVTIKSYTKACDEMQSVLMRAVEDAAALEKAYEKYQTDDLAN